MHVFPAFLNRYEEPKGNLLGGGAKMVENRRFENPRKSGTHPATS